MACLGAVERRDLGGALAALLPGAAGWAGGGTGLGAGLSAVAVRGRDAALCVGRELTKLGVEDWAVIDLEVGG